LLEIFELHFLKSLLKQEVGYFDQNDTGKLTARLSSDIAIIQSGTSEKLGLTLQFTAQFFAAVGVALYYGWQLTLVILSITPVFAIAGGIQARLITSGTQKAQDVYSYAGQTAEEVIGGIRTVKSFTNEEKEQVRFENQLNVVLKYGKTKAAIISISFAFFNFAIYSIYSLGFWYGGTRVADGEMTVGAVITTFFSILFSAFGLVQATQQIPDIAKAKGAASAIFGVIDRIPLISGNLSGKKIEKTTGNLELKGYNIFLSITT